MIRGSELRRTILLALGIAGAMPVGSVAAQPPPPDGPDYAQTEPEKETARSLYRLGNERYASGDYRGALEAFEGAHRIMEVATTGLGLGKTQAKLGLLLEARDTLGGVARLPVRDGEPGPMVKAREEAAALTADLAQRIPSLKVVVTTTDGGTPDAQVSVDGEVLTPELEQIAHDLNPGIHLVRISAEGYVATAQSIELEETETRTLQVMLARVPVVAAPVPPPTLPPMQAPPSLAPRHDPVGDDDRTATSVMVAGFAIGGTGLVAGAITGAISLSAASDLEAACNADKSCPPSAEGDRDVSLATAHVSTVSFVVGGLGVATGVAALVVVGSRSKPSASSVAIALSPSGIGLEGTW